MHKFVVNDIVRFKDGTDVFIVTRVTPRSVMIKHMINGRIKTGHFSAAWSWLEYVRHSGPLSVRTCTCSRCSVKVA